MDQRTLTIAAGLIVLAVVGWIYWPVVHAGWIWDDHTCLHESAWLRHGDGWKHYVFQGYCDWVDYFRPLVVASWVIQVRAFDVTPGPMHAMSLAIHLANTLLIGMLASKLPGSFKVAIKPALAAAFSMAVYGIHPLLVEPIFWIGCQAELILNFFILLGLLLNVSMRHSTARAIAVGVCFFLAACSKESAISFPPILLILDLMVTRSEPSQYAWRTALRSTWQRQWRVYLCLLLAGIGYLTFRYWALGYLVLPHIAQSLSYFGRVQKICLTYMMYWRTLAWPMIGLGPIHPVSEESFAAIDAGSLAVDAAAMALVLAGMILFARRKLLGGLILAVTVGLFPVLYIIPITFQESLYHERYAMTALAIACALVPCVTAELAPPLRARLLGVVTTIAAILWLAIAVVNVRVTLPLWADELKLWQWALRENPNSLTAKEHLLSTYIDRDDRAQARVLADTMVAAKLPCSICMLNAAFMALTDGDINRASAALDNLKDSNALAYNKRLLHNYVLANGELLELQGDPVNAEEAYRDAITLDTFDASPHMYLGLLLARQGKVVEGRKETDLALTLFAPDQREENRKLIEEAIAMPTAAPAH
jgi:tetratricopeptide (TPR) repeat protein